MKRPTHEMAELLMIHNMEVKDKQRYLTDNELCVLIIYINDLIKFFKALDDKVVVHYFVNISIGLINMARAREIPERNYTLIP